MEKRVVDLEKQLAARLVRRVRLIVLPRMQPSSSTESGGATDDHEGHFQLVAAIPTRGSRRNDHATGNTTFYSINLFGYMVSTTKN